MVASVSNIQPDEDVLVEMHRRMPLIRKSEVQLLLDAKTGRTPGQVHLSDGREAVAAGILARLDERDQAASTHRAHGHRLARGRDMNAMFAEICGRTEGICRVVGGSIHVAGPSKGIAGANGIAGAGLGIATGAALAKQLEGDALCEVETKGVSSEVEAPGDGVTPEVLAGEEAVAVVGQDTCIFESA